MSTTFTVRKNKQKGKAEALLDQIMEAPSTVNVIHYSCESFYDIKDGRSPRITSIAVQNLDNGQAHSFSIHQIAERKGIPFAEVETKYDELEKIMLYDFYVFVEKHLNNKWLHWNMKNSNYGFQAIENRYRVLGGNPIIISDSNLFDLARILVSIYGAKYVKHPRLERLMEENSITKMAFLTGYEEAIAFEKKDYAKLHQSTLRKADVIASIAERAWKGDLKTNATWKDLHGNSLIGFIEGVSNHWVFKAVTIIGTILGIVLGIYTALPAK